MERGEDQRDKEVTAARVEKWKPGEKGSSRRRLCTQERREQGRESEGCLHLGRRKTESGNPKSQVRETVKDEILTVSEGAERGRDREEALDLAMRKSLVTFESSFQRVIKVGDRLQGVTVRE